MIEIFSGDNKFKRFKFLFKNLNVLIILCGVMAIGMSVFFYFFQKNNDQEILNYAFKGRVDSVWYNHNNNDQDSITKPYVIIDGKSYHLFYRDWDFGYKIKRGDSMIKKKNTTIITLIKMNGRKIVYKLN